MRNSCSGPKLKLIRQNLRIVKRLYPDVTELQLSTLREISASLQLSISSGDLMLLDGRWYVTHSGLLRTAKHMRCSGINTELEGNVSNPTMGRWVFKATVCQSGKSFVGYGDADPSNVSPLIRGAEMRVADGRLTGRFARPTASASAQSRRSALSRQRSLNDKHASSRRNQRTGTMAAQRSAIGSARSSVSINSIPTW